MCLVMLQNIFIKNKKTLDKKKYFIFALLLEKSII
jgi:hypothetical protein